MKSIVPTWLQRYFRQNEEASTSEQRSQEENVNYHPAFANDIADDNLEIDGRITPEPTIIISEGRLKIPFKLTAILYKCAKNLKQVSF